MSSEVFITNMCTENQSHWEKVEKKVAIKATKNRALSIYNILSVTPIT